MHVDVVVSMIVYTLATIAFYLLGAGILHVMGQVPGGIWWVDLAAVIDAEGIARAALAAVDARPPEEQSPRDALVALVARRGPLVILDNCEHLHVSCAELAAALLAAFLGERWG